MDIGNLVRVQYDPKGKTAFRISQDEDSLMLSFRRDLLKGLEQSIFQATGVAVSGFAVCPN
jgi:hypothetical protein